ncbi:MAG TPA: NUDIX domain-containing protein [Verrucomicrobiae bacterium]|nr:NUDIX domain-containing protein [Verrucomicrobiae bacterium]
MPQFSSRDQTGAMALPYKIATLLYCFNERDEILLLERTLEPNIGLWSPCGGKLRTETGESPYACACREAGEELGVELRVSDLHLAGIVSEHGYLGQSHWLMFLFEVKRRINELPPPHREGRFQFFKRAELENVKLPQTDREVIWPWFWKYRGGFFAAHCHCHPNGKNDWTLQETWRPGRDFNAIENSQIANRKL